MDEQVFSDGIGSITIVGGAVRVDFVTLSPTERDANGRPALVFAKRVVLPLEAFARSLPKIHEATQALIKLGVIQPQRAGAVEPGARPDAEAAVPDRAVDVNLGALEPARTRKPPFP